MIDYADRLKKIRLKMDLKQICTQWYANFFSNIFLS